MREEVPVQMNDHGCGFAKGALLEAWDRAMSDAVSAMDRCVSARNDVLQETAAPDREAAGLLCGGEPSAWRHEKAVLKVDLLFWGTSFAISSLLLLGTVLGSIYVRSLMMTLALVLLSFPMAAPGFITASYVADSAARSRICTRCSRHPHQQWIQLVGIWPVRAYVVHNTLKEGSVTTVDVYKYDDLATPLVEYESNQIAVELPIRDDSLVRVMILPGDAGFQVQQIVAFLEKNKPDHDQKSLNYSSLAIR